MGKKAAIDEATEPSIELLEKIKAFHEKFDPIKQNFYDNIEILKKMLEETDISDVLNNLRKKVDPIYSKLFVVLETITANLNYWEKDRWIVMRDHIVPRVIHNE